MIQPEKIKSAIETSVLSQPEKQQLLVLQPKLGDAMQQFLFKEVDRADSDLGGAELIQALSSLVQASDDLTKGSESEFLKLLQTAQNAPLFDFGKTVLPFLQDVRKLFALRRVSLSNQGFQSMIDFEIALFRDLPNNSLAEIISKHLLYALSKTDVLMECKRVYYWQNKEMDATWIPLLLRSLEANAELLGSKPIQGGGKLSDPTIASWLKDFMALAKIGAARTTLGLVEYLSKSPNVLALSKSEQQTLPSVLKIYLWLRDPKVTQEEIDAYEVQLGNILAGKTISKTNKLEQNFSGIITAAQTINKANPNPPVPRPPRNEKHAVNLQEQLIAAGPNQPEGLLTSPAAGEKRVVQRSVPPPLAPAVKPSLATPAAPKQDVSNVPQAPLAPPLPKSPPTGIRLKPDIFGKRTSSTPNVQDLINTEQPRDKSTAARPGMTLGRGLPPTLDMEKVKKEAAGGKDSVDTVDKSA